MFSRKCGHRNIRKHRPECAFAYLDRPQGNVGIKPLFPGAISINDAIDPSVIVADQHGRLAEDQGGEPRLADIRNRFGDRVADIVHACSDSVANTAAGQQKDDWRTRKMRYKEHLKTVDRETRLVSLSDKVHNARSILRDLRKPEIGPAVWNRFGNRPKEDTLWYYRELANAFQELLPGQLAEELMEIVIVLENE
jgi:hypothetical protein